MGLIIERRRSVWDIVLGLLLVGRVRVRNRRADGR